MGDFKTITSRHNPVVARFRDVAGRRPGSNLILLDGEHLVEEALAAQVRITALAVSADAGEPPGVRRLGEIARQRGAETYRVTSAVMGAISPVRSPSRVVALAEQPRWTLDSAFEGPAPLVLAALDVQEPGNVGAIVRAAEAGGATAVLFAGASADPFSWKAIRGSMGSVLRVPVAQAPIGDVTQAAQARGVRVAATVPRGGRSLFDTDLRAGVLLLLGGEGPGLPEATVEGADERITIPMHSPVESLNVAVAAGVLVYEAARQRR
jgi:RNA methyltransferase, TrmH family